MWRCSVVVLVAVVGSGWLASPGESRAATLTLPAPLFFENFDAVPEGSLPAGWSATNFTEVLTPAIDFANLDSAAYAGWTVLNVSRFSGPLVQYSNPANPAPVYQRVLSVNPGDVVNGQPVTNLASGRCLFANSGYRRGRSQVQYLFSPDYDFRGKSNVFLSFHSIYEQNQDSFGAVEYSTNQGVGWLPVVYMLDSADLLSTAGAVDPVATLSTIYADVATYLESGGSIVRGGYYGAFIAVASNLWSTLGPFLSGRVNDDPVESKRVELFRLTSADNQARVRFRFAHAGTDSWYFGVDDFGLYSINASDLPSVAAAAPRALRLSAGTTATFSVAATGVPPLSYQWLRNGTPLPDATNAILTLPALAENQGAYTVAVSNPAGTVVIQAGTVAVYLPRVTGQWDFDAGDLRATLGAALEFRGDTESITTFGTRSIGAELSGVMGFASTGIDQGYRLRHGARPNGGGQFVNQYTLILDL